MKHTLIALMIACLFSCEKEVCKTCTRTWAYASQLEDQHGAILGDYHSWNGDVETFDVCGDAGIENAEKRIDTKLREPADSGMVKVTFGIGKCNCN